MDCAHQIYVQVVHFCLGLSGPQIWMSALQRQEGIRCPPGGHLPGQLDSKRDQGGAALTAWRGESDQGKKEQAHNLL